MDKLSATTKFVALLISAGVVFAGAVAVVVTARADVGHLKTQITKLEARQATTEKDMREALGRVQLNLARICVAVEADCRD